MSKQHGILFKAEMVRAILDGRKTMTRRLIKPQPMDCSVDHLKFEEAEWRHKPMILSESTIDKGHFYCGYCGNGTGYNNEFKGIKARYSVGDILYVKETFQQTDESISIDPGYVYIATDLAWETMEGWKWKPSIFMPKKAARIWLEVTGVKCERVSEISEEDAIKEGISIHDFGIQTPKGSASVDGGKTFHPFKPVHVKLYSHLDNPKQDECLRTARYAFGSLWNSINGEETWNHWCFAYSFKRIDNPNTPTDK